MERDTFPSEGVAQKGSCNASVANACSSTPDTSCHNRLRIVTRNALYQCSNMAGCRNIPSQILYAGRLVRDSMSRSWTLSSLWVPSHSG